MRKGPFAMAIILLASLSTTAMIPIHLGSSGTLSVTLQDQTWTVMVYMAADALPELPWENDINEMESVDHGEGLDIIALVDPYGPSNTMLLDVKEDPNWLDPAIVSEEIPFVTEADMSSAGMLTLFIETSAARHPADRYVLVLWGHGAGWRGVCLDGYDLLTLPELGSALESATDTLGRSLDMVIIDSCAEGTLECAYEIREHADYLAASEMNVQADGLPYDSVFEALAADLHQSPADFGEAVIDAYIDWAYYGSYYSATMALYDLSAMDDLLGRLGALSEQGYRYDRLFGDQMRNATLDAESYDDEWAVDAGDLVGELRRADLPLEMKESLLRLVPAYQQAIAYFRAYSHPNPADGLKAEAASGATIYAPSAESADAAYSDLEIALTPWFNFGFIVRSDDETWQNELGVEVMYSDSADDDDSAWDIAVLTWQNVSGAGAPFQAWVFGSYGVGVSLLSVTVSDVPMITVEGFFGTLIVAVSASLYVYAAAYEELTIELHGTIELQVEVDRSGVPQDDGYDVALIRPGAEALELTPRNGLFWIDLNVPSEVDLGCMYAIRVTEHDTGDVVGETVVVLWDSSANASVDLLPPKTEEDKMAVIVIAAATLASTILVAAYAVRWRRSRCP